MTFNTYPQVSHCADGQSFLQIRFTSGIISLQPEEFLKYSCREDLLTMNFLFLPKNILTLCISSKDICFTQDCRLVCSQHFKDVFKCLPTFILSVEMGANGYFCHCPESNVSFLPPQCFLSISFLET